MEKDLTKDGEKKSDFIVMYGRPELDNTVVLRISFYKKQGFKIDHFQKECGHVFDPNTIIISFCFQDF